MKRFAIKWLRSIFKIMFIISASASVLSLAFLVHLAFIHSQVLGGIFLILIISLIIAMWDDD